VKFYGDTLKGSGLKATTNVISTDGANNTGVVAAEDEAKKRSVMVNASVSEGKTEVTVGYSAKP
jgi:hypothetical protein